MGVGRTATFGAAAWVNDDADSEDMLPGGNALVGGRSESQDINMRKAKSDGRPTPRGCGGHLWLGLGLQKSWTGRHSDAKAGWALYLPFHS